MKESFGKPRLLADALGEFGRSLTVWDDPDDGWEDFVLALFDSAAPVCLVGMAAFDHASGIFGVAVNFDEVGVGVLRAEYIQMGVRTQPHTLTVPIDVLAPAVWFGGDDRRGVLQVLGSLGGDERELRHRKGVGEECRGQVFWALAIAASGEVSVSAGGERPDTYR